MALPEMIYEGMHDLLLPVVQYRFLLRYYDLEGGTRGAAVNGFADLDELRFFGDTAHSSSSHRQVSALLESQTNRLLTARSVSPLPGYSAAHATPGFSVSLHVSSH